MPSKLHINAYTGQSVPGTTLHSEFRQWIGSGVASQAQLLSSPHMADLTNCKDEDVGWGLILLENPELSAEQQATACDAPQAINTLLSHRGGVVLRWAPDLQVNKLRRYYANGDRQDVDISLSKRGNAKGRLPHYLLLHGPPTVLPWELQYRLNMVAFTGRLDLDEVGLINYVNAVVSEWHNNALSASKSLTWAVDHGGGDITTLMRKVIAEKVHKSFSDYEDIDAVYIDGQQSSATIKRLHDTLISHQPGMIVTTSHGKTGPLNDVPTMTSSMGMLVDADFATLDVETLLSNWQPNGSIWYAHACCSAGCNNTSAYKGLIDEHSQVAEVLNGVAACGSMVSPLPKALLGSTKPLRAFVGQVEPTFDWSIRDPDTGQWLTNPLSKALFQHLYQPWPIGYAFTSVHRAAPTLESLHQDAIRGATQGETPTERETHQELALRLRLVAQDLRSMVILGDPAESVVV